jgi:hypothetical protein
VGAPWAGYHSLRHTAASLMIARGDSPVQVQRRLGHHSPGFTLAVYVHLFPGEGARPLDLGDELTAATRVATDQSGTDRTGLEAELAEVLNVQGFPD